MVKKASIPLLAGLILICAPYTKSHAAGCVATRGADMHHNFFEPYVEHSPIPEMELTTAKPSSFQASFAYRQFKSNKHFVGGKEQKHRQREGSEVINNSRFMDFGLTYFIDDRWSATLTIPLVFHDRSQVVRDASRNILDRYHTQSAGMGDMRIVGNHWMLDPQLSEKGNILLGFGLDIPTGQKDETDTFMKYDSGSGLIIAEERPVDQSIQPGDGGWGVILDFYAYRKLFTPMIAYFSANYTLTPEEKNGVLTYRSNPFEAEMSIADSYLVRTGFDYLAWPEQNLRTGLGIRMAGVPVNDLIGGSKGFRRPGYDISIEPSIALDIDVWSFNLSVPIAFDRNRQRSVADEEFAKVTGTPRHGDAAFADYEVLFSVSKRF
jgi:hypothetical protein